MASHRPLKPVGNHAGYLPLGPLVHVADGARSRSAFRPGPLREDIKSRSLQTVHAALPRFGVDLSYHRTTIDDRLARDFRTKYGVTFVVRYLARAAKKGKDPGKGLTADEAMVWSRAGIDLVCVYEVSERRAADGSAAGKADAVAARRLADLCGMPKTAPIYFAVDYDAVGHDLLNPRTPDMPHIYDYFRAIAKELGLSCTGAYGGYGVIKALFDRNLIVFGWQTYAWSNGKLDSRAQLYQYEFYDKKTRKHLEFEHIQVDYDEANHDYFGQWRAVYGRPTH